MKVLERYIAKSIKSCIVVLLAYRGRAAAYVKNFLLKRFRLFSNIGVRVGA